jgi:Sec-independent protein translocase protein TatA
MAKKTQSIVTTLENAVSDAYAALGELRDEVQEVYDNAPDSLKETSRNQTLSETGDTLSQHVDDEPSIENDEVKNLEVVYAPLKPRASRSKRRDYATGILSACLSALEQYNERLQERKEALEKSETEEAQTRVLELEDLLSQVEELQDTLENCMGEADGCEFPGMFG